MPIQTFNIYTGRGYAGELVDSGPRVVQSGVLTSTSAGFGLAMSRDATIERGVKLSDTGTAGTPVNIYAISQREYNHEAATRPSDGTTLYNETETVSLIRQGYLYLELDVANNALTAGDTLNFTTATGRFTSDTAATTVTVETLNITVDETIVVSGTPVLAKCRIDIVAA